MDRTAYVDESEPDQRADPGAYLLAAAVVDDPDAECHRGTMSYLGADDQLQHDHLRCELDVGGAAPVLWAPGVVRRPVPKRLRRSRGTAAPRSVACLCMDGAGGFDVRFPAIAGARERMRGADFQTRMFGVQSSDAAERASAAAGRGDLPGALESLAGALTKASNKTANVAEELWQALEKAQHEYERSDAAAGAGIDAVGFGGHDGHR